MFFTLLDMTPGNGVPIGALVFLMDVVGIPNGYPYHGQSTQDRQAKFATHTSILQRLDINGLILLMMSTLAFTVYF